MFLSVAALAQALLGDGAFALSSAFTSNPAVRLYCLIDRKEDQKDLL